MRLLVDPRAREDHVGLHGTHQYQYRGSRAAVPPRRRGCMILISTMTGSIDITVGIRPVRASISKLLDAYERVELTR